MKKQALLIVALLVGIIFVSVYIQGYSSHLARHTYQTASVDGFFEWLINPKDYVIPQQEQQRISPRVLYDMCVNSCLRRSDGAVSHGEHDDLWQDPNGLQMCIASCARHYGINPSQ